MKKTRALLSCARVLFIIKQPETRLINQESNLIDKHFKMLYNVMKIINKAFNMSITNDVNLSTIKSLILSNFKEFGIEIKQMLLFGSRVRGDSDPDSDYDLMVIVRGKLEITVRRALASSVRKILAKNNIDIDILIKPEAEFDEYINIPCSISMSASLEGVPLL